MKLAPWVGLGAIAALLGVVAWAVRPPCGCDGGVPTPLDFSGIDTLEVSADSVSVDVVPAGKPLQLRQPVDFHARIKRSGTTLRIEGGDDDVSLSIDAPDTLRRIVLPEGGQVNAEQAPVADLDVEARGNLDWKGDAHSLRILHRGAQENCDEEDYNCKADVTIWSGKIDKLEVRLPDGDLNLHNASDVARVAIELGPEASYGFINMDGPAPQVEILKPGTPEDEPEGTQESAPPTVASGKHDEPPPPASVDAVSTPAEPAAKPPRRP